MGHRQRSSPAAAAGATCSRRSRSATSSSGGDGGELHRHRARHGGALAASRGLDFHALAASAVTGRERSIASRPRCWVLARSSVAARRSGAPAGGAGGGGTGGYASARRRSARASRGGRCSCSSPTPTAGLANRALSRFATAAAVAWPETAQRAALSGARDRRAGAREFFARPAALPAGSAVAAAGARRQPGCGDAQRRGAGGARRLRRERGLDARWCIRPVAARRRDARRAYAGERRSGRGGGAVPRRRPGRDGGEPSRPVARRRHHARRDLRRRPAGAPLAAGARGGASGSRTREALERAGAADGGGGSGRGGGARRRRSAVVCSSPQRLASMARAARSLARPRRRGGRSRTWPVRARRRWREPMMFRQFAGLRASTSSASAAPACGASPRCCSTTTSRSPAPTRRRARRPSAWSRSACAPLHGHTPPTTSRAPTSW